MQATMGESLKSTVQEYIVFPIMMSVLLAGFIGKVNETQVPQLGRTWFRRTKNSLI